MNEIIKNEKYWTQFAKNNGDISEYDGNDISIYALAFIEKPYTSNVPKNKLTEEFYLKIIEISPASYEYFPLEARRNPKIIFKLIDLLKDKADVFKELSIAVPPSIEKNKEIMKKLIESSLIFVLYLGAKISDVELKDLLIEKLKNSDKKVSSSFNCDDIEPKILTKEDILTLLDIGIDIRPTILKKELRTREIYKKIVEKKFSYIKYVPSKIRKEIVLDYFKESKVKYEDLEHIEPKLVPFSFFKKFVSYISSIKDGDTLRCKFGDRSIFKLFLRFFHRLNKSELNTFYRLLEANLFQFKEIPFKYQTKEMVDILVNSKIYRIKECFFLINPDLITEEILIKAIADNPEIYEFIDNPSDIITLTYEKYK